MFFFSFSLKCSILAFWFPFSGYAPNAKNKIQRLVKRDMEEQVSSERIDDRAKEMIDIDDNIPFSVNNASTNDSTHIVPVILNTTTLPDQIEPVGKFMFTSTSLKTETIVLLLMFGICTIIYSGKYWQY